MWKENVGTQAGVHLVDGVCLIWGPLNTGFNVLIAGIQQCDNVMYLCLNSGRVKRTWSTEFM